MYIMKKITAIILSMLILAGMSSCGEKNNTSSVSSEVSGSASSTSSNSSNQNSYEPAEG